jgi:hypothetical protein
MTGAILACHFKPSHYLAGSCRNNLFCHCRRIDNQPMEWEMYEFWRKWFVWAAWAMVVLGIGFAGLGLTPAMAFVTDLYDPFFWNDGAPDEGARAFQVFSFGVMGALMAGWGTMALGLGRHPMARREAWSWHYSVAGIGLWFVIDTLMSVASGATINVAGNIGFLVLFAPPLLGMRRHMISAAPARHATQSHQS